MIQHHQHLREILSNAHLSKAFVSDIVSSREMLQMYGGQVLLYVSSVLVSDINAIVGIIAAMLGLVVVIFSIINSCKKSKLLDLEIKEKEKNLSK